MADRDYRAQLGVLADALRNPLRLRMAVCGVALAVAYFGIYGPLNEQIRLSSRALGEAEKRLATAHAASLLRSQAESFQARISPSPDASEAVQHVLNGVRSLPLKLARLDSQGVVSVGPYEAVTLQIEVLGEPQQLDAFLGWLETNSRLLRIDSLQFEPAPLQNDAPKMRLRLIALKVRR